MNHPDCETRAVIRDVKSLFTLLDKLMVIIYFVVAVGFSHLFFGFPHFAFSTFEINVCVGAVAATLVGGSGWVVVRFVLRRRKRSRMSHTA